MSYNRMDHAKWVEQNNQAANQIYGKRKSYKPAPEKLSAFQAKVMDICGMVGGGIYNAPINWNKVSWGTGNNHIGMFVPWRDGRMATFDFYPLTMLVLLCHEARIRCEICAALVRDCRRDPADALDWAAMETLGGGTFTTEYSILDLIAEAKASPLLPLGDDDDEHDAECGTWCAGEAA